MQASHSTLGWLRRGRILAVLGVGVFFLQFLAPSLHAIAEHSASADWLAQDQAPKGAVQAVAKSGIGASRTAPMSGTTAHDPSQCAICKNLAQLRGNIVIVEAAFVQAPSPQTVAIAAATPAVTYTGLDRSSSPRAPPTSTPIAD